jgi:hypothetical protein
MAGFCEHSNETFGFIKGGVEIAIEKLKRYNSSGIDQILAELIQTGGNKLHSEIHKFINSVWNKEELPQWCGMNLLYLFIKKGDESD